MHRFDPAFGLCASAAQKKVSRRTISPTASISTLPANLPPQRRRLTGEGPNLSSRG
jgi:hypothetical protein